MYYELGESFRLFLSIKSYPHNHPMKSMQIVCFSFRKEIEAQKASSIVQS